METTLSSGHFFLLQVWLCDELRTGFFKLPEETPGIFAEILSSPLTGHFLLELRLHAKLQAAREFSLFAFLDPPPSPLRAQS
ncbi:MAG TPA: hypothetical protein VMB49_06120, partial [Acidobacteriaceae bacterium]|nr:hypothetical protein [Acidobacteriaceae bacterium]